MHTPVSFHSIPQLMQCSICENIRMPNPTTLDDLDAFPRARVPEAETFVIVCSPDYLEEQEHDRCEQGKL